MKLLVINPAAGNGQGKKIGIHTEEIFRERKIPFDSYYSEKPGAIIPFCKSINFDNYDAIIAVGGDGTLYEVANGIMNADMPEKMKVGVIPVGTGNSFTHDIGVHNDITGAIDSIQTGETRLVDVGYYISEEQKFYFLNILGIGFVADVCAVADRYKKFKKLSYAIGVLQVTSRLAAFELELTIDQNKYIRKNCFVEICNSRYTGGDMLMAPQASIHDGYLDVILLNEISRLNLLKAFPSVFKGDHLGLSAVETFRAKQIKIVTNPPKTLTPDGEITGQTPIEVGIIPKRLQVLGRWTT